MRDIKELIFAAVEENAVQFQELANELLHARAYEAIEALRPEVGASMFGEAKKMDDEDEGDIFRDRINDFDPEDEDEDEKKSKVEEELKGNQHKIDKNKNGKIDAHDFKLLRKEEAEELDELNKKTLASYVGKSAVSLRKPNIDIARGIDVKKNIDKVNKREDGIALAAKKLAKEEVEEADEKQVGKEIKVARLKKDSSDFMASRTDLFPRSATSLTKHLAKKDDEKYGEAMKKVKDTPVSKFLASRKGSGKVRTEEVGLDEVDEAVRIRDRAYSGIERGHGDDKTTFQGKMDRMHIAAGAKARRKRTGPGVKGFNSAMRPAKASDGYQPRETGSVRAKNEEVVNEVAMPKNAADWQALINHQVKITGHPVATDAQFRAAHGKDTSKIASQEPPEDKLNYAAAQGGTVKQ